MSMSELMYAAGMIMIMASVDVPNPPILEKPEGEREMTELNNNVSISFWIYERTCTCTLGVM